MINFLIINTKSKGQQIDARVLRSVIERSAENLKININIKNYVLSEDNYNPIFDNVKNSFIGKSKNLNILLFIENLIECDALYQENTLKILVPNLEWVNEYTRRNLNKVDQFWHKTRFSNKILKDLYPNSAHFYVGFSSKDPGLTIKANKTFGHFRGKSPFRHTNEILAAWRDNPGFPTIKIHFCPEEINAMGDNIHCDGWFKNENILLYVGEMEEDKYYQEVSSCEFMLCLSASEGFGHYINEARAMGALVCSIDAPPMNELISFDCGFLIKPVSRSPQALGWKYKITQNEVVSLVNSITSSSDEKISQLKINARKRYLEDRADFEENIATMISQLNLLI